MPSTPKSKTAVTAMFKSQKGTKALDKVVREFVRAAVENYKKTGQLTGPELDKAVQAYQPRHAEVMKEAKKVDSRAERLAAREAAKTPGAKRVWADEAAGGA